MLDNSTVRLFHSATALDSLRNTDFDFPTAIGELIDNSLQARAKKINIHILTTPQTIDNLKLDVISKVAVADNGDGMTIDVIHRCLQVGYSTRYDDRNGIGRFGVGATYAAISQAKRITVMSRSEGEEDFYATYIDLDEISTTGETEISPPAVYVLEEDLAPLITPDTRTVVIWGKCDRLGMSPSGRPRSWNIIVNELQEWVSRAYRYFLWDGVEIYINDQKVISHDPLYLRPSETNFPGDPPATVRLDETIQWPTPNNPSQFSDIRIILTLLPEELRPHRGSGGSSEAKARRIDENHGVSILRHNREVAFKNFWPIVPSAIEIDRWWGCEIHFEPELDEWWEIRNIKRGAMPVDELRERLKEVLYDPSKPMDDRLVTRVRKEITNFWDSQAQNTSSSDGTDTSNTANTDGTNTGENDETENEAEFQTNNESTDGSSSSVETENTDNEGENENVGGAGAGVRRPARIATSTRQVTLLLAREPEQIVERICKRFHLVAQQLTSRHSGRPTIQINDEYDVQDLLHALLKLEFDDVRPEEWTPSYAGRSSRMDFLLRNERIVVEVKKTRAGLNAATLGDELIIDIHHYQAHPSWRTLICFVFDPDGRIANPRGLENDLSKYYGALKVEVYITPS